MEEVVSAVAPASAEPHSPQNFCPAGLVAWQRGQLVGKGRPHPPQYLKPSGLA
jgi:hypothetical protein